jgi:hypothetical protein
MTALWFRVGCENASATEEIENITRGARIDVDAQRFQRQERNMVSMKWFGATLLALGSLAAIAQTNQPAPTAPVAPATAPAAGGTAATQPPEAQVAKALTAEDVNA